MSRNCAALLADSGPMLYTMTDDRQLRGQEICVFLIRYSAAGGLIMVSEVFSLRVLEVEWFWCWC